MPKYRSRFEEIFNETHRLPYETHSFEYVKKHKYKPDFQLNSSTFLELKGLMPASDRTKMVMTREQNPGTTFIIVFQNAKLKLNKKSNTSYGDWATKAGFEWYDAKDVDSIAAMVEKFSTKSF